MSDIPQHNLRRPQFREEAWKEWMGSCMAHACKDTEGMRVFYVCGFQIRLCGTHVLELQALVSSGLGESGSET